MLGHRLQILITRASLRDQFKFVLQLEREIWFVIRSVRWKTLFLKAIADVHQFHGHFDRAICSAVVCNLLHAS